MNAPHAATTGHRRPRRTDRPGGPAAAPWRCGLDAASAISGNGGYRDGAAEEVLALPTCAWRGLEFTTFGEEPIPLFAPGLPASYSVRQVRQSWTGKAYAYRWRGGDLTLDLRTTLPGPLFRTSGRTIRIRGVAGSEWRSFTDLDQRGYTIGSISSGRLSGARAWVVESKHLPYVLVASQPVTRIRVTTHTYYEFTFARPGARLLVAPLICAGDVPRDTVRRQLWQQLVDRPPLEAVEHYRFEADRLHIRTSFPGATLAPLPPAVALLEGEAGARDQADAERLITAPAGQQLLRTWCGPFQVVAGSRYEVGVAMAWSQAAMRPTRKPRPGTLAEIPEELAYAGDATWAPGTVMDQLLALRTWAPLVASAPAALQQRLLPLLRVPTPAQLRQGVEIIAEPASGLSWGRWRQMWDHTGDAAYDIDWYNGLGLSGLARAAESACADLAVPARRLAAAGRRERTALLDYFKVFHDWALCTAWSDPRGWLWNADCLHNGMEGILAEGRLRAAEHDLAGAAECRYLAGRHAIGLRASLALPAWMEENARLAATPRAAGHRISRMVTWSGSPDPSPGAAPAPAIGVQGLTSWRDACFATTLTRNPYVLAGHNPEWNQLLASHTSRAWREQLRAAYDAERARSDDWVAFYIGQDWQARAKAGDQEARIQAAVFYHLAPEVAFRRFVLGESAEDIEGRFRTPLGLAEQLLLRAGVVLESTPQAAAAPAQPAAASSAGHRP